MDFELISFNVIRLMTTSRLAEFEKNLEKQDVQQIHHYAPK